MLNRIRGGRIGTSQRRDRSETKDLPGPGAYNSKSCFYTLNKSMKDGIKSGISFTKSTRMGSTIGGNTSNPGPGRYSVANHSIGKNKRKLTIGVKLKHELNKTLPGPADYQTRTPMRIKGGRIGTTKRLFNLKRENDPSPHSYSPDVQTVKPKTPRFTFPSGRKKLIIEDTPGPSHYLAEKSYQSLIITPKLSKGTSSMLSRTKKSTLQLREGPGPLNYNPSVSFVRSSKPAFSIKKELRDSSGSIKKTNDPGPASYNTTMSKKAVQNILFERATRSVMGEDKLHTPGPGTYNLRRTELEVKGKNSKVLKRLRKMFCSKLRKNIKKKH